MCSITGIFSADPAASIDAAVMARMRERMAHRGPDGAGLWQAPGIAFGHRRLAIIDRSASGAQPMLWVCRTADRGSDAHPMARGRAVPAAEGFAPVSGDRIALGIVYNGELYNDAELRVELSGMGVEFRSRSDTETILAALAVWGFAGIDRLRGMYGIACFDLVNQRLLLARDPLGIKPLYYSQINDGSPTIAFASEIPALLEHPGIRARPDPVVVSSYLTTIRTTLGDRTLYEGIRALEPGDQIVAARDRGSLRLTRISSWDNPHAHSHPHPQPLATDVDIRSAVEDSVQRHLRSDVPVCCLLSGGLDSSIIARIARDGSTEAMTTFCAGADGVSGGSDDFAFARKMADSLGSEHIEAPVSRAMFRERWGSMVDRIGVPMSTPNEVAINEVSRRLRASGFPVALSGEGADELFGGYDIIMSQCEDHIAGLDPRASWRDAGGRFHLDLAAWAPVEAKSAILSESMLAGIEGDRQLIEQYERVFARCAAGVEDGEPMQAHLRFQRRVNLAGLLLRLDQASMLESVEGRTPLADDRIARLAESLPMDRKFVRGGDEGKPNRTKIALREAFGRILPREIVARAKASFPLPFQEWLPDAADMLRGSTIAREWFSDAAIALVLADPAKSWKIGWPMLNLALWGRRFQ